MEMATGCAPWRHIAKDKLRVLYRIGSARGELPLPPLMRAWAEEASDWLAYEKGMTASVAARDVAVDPSVLPCSAKKDALVEEEEGGHLRRRESSGETAGAGGVPDRQRRRLEDGPTVAGVAGNEVHVDAAREHISSPERDCDSPSSLLMTRCNTSATLAPSTLSRTASPTPASVLPVAPVPHFSAKVGTHATDSDEEAASAEEQLLRSQSRVMQLYVELQSFVSACVKVRPEDRSSAEELLNHPFLTL